MSKLFHAVFTDIDEFVVLKQHKSLAEFLKPFEPHAACVYVPWRIFGSSNLQLPQAAGVLQSYPACQRLNASYMVMGKSISNMKHVKYQTVHACLPVDGKLMVSPDSTTLQPPANLTALANLTGNVAMLYHYRIKSWDEYRHKQVIGALCARVPI
jgi:hypothetical protein